MRTYAGTLLVSSVLSFLVIPLVIRNDRRRNLVDHPSPRKVQSVAVPNLGPLGQGSRMDMEARPVGTHHRAGIRVAPHLPDTRFPLPANC